MVVKSFNDDSKNLWKLKELLNDSNIPFLIDIHQFDKLPESFHKEIEKDYVIVFNSNT